MRNPLPQAIGRRLTAAEILPCMTEAAGLSALARDVIGVSPKML